MKRRNPFKYPGGDIPEGLINLDYVHWYYYESWRAPWFWVRYWVLKEWRVRPQFPRWLFWLWAAFMVTDLLQLATEWKWAELLFLALGLTFIGYSFWRVKAWKLFYAFVIVFLGGEFVLVLLVKLIFG